MREDALNLDVTPTQQLGRLVAPGEVGLRIISVKRFFDTCLTDDRYSDVIGKQEAMSIKHHFPGGTAHTVEQARALKMARTILGRSESKLGFARDFDGDPKAFCDIKHKVVMTEALNGGGGSVVADFRDGVDFQDSVTVTSSDDDTFTESWRIKQSGDLTTYTIDTELVKSNHGTMNRYREWKSNLPGMGTSLAEKGKGQVRLTQRMNPDGTVGDMWLIEGRDSWAQKAVGAAGRLYQAARNQIKGLGTIKIEFGSPEPKA